MFLIFPTFSMASLLAKFRIDYHDVTVIPDVAKKAKDETKSEFREIARIANISETGKQKLRWKNICWAFDFVLMTDRGARQPKCWAVVFMNLQNNRDSV